MKLFDFLFRRYKWYRTDTRIRQGATWVKICIVRHVDYLTFPLELYRWKRLSDLPNVIEKYWIKEWADSLN